ncbi:ABC transporter substrate-binding protein [Clostridium polyendosporum]|uniref:ABC transporter substrate-binding protein n=1 Tax=Clostridium polyendosporum TaxID=69208 RepID=A0A919S054_9CLOT|nr:ABC transporter substrate-binding protein [Clostridium polyendosporum]GIM28999.1 ABC transporter substrate-binding protein [Clostridium polyendosporum]
MVSRKRLLALISTVVLSTILFMSCSESTKSTNKSNKIKIGVTQIAEHPALDASRKGFVDALASKGFNDGKNLEIDYQNAQGEIATAQTIAQNFVSQKKDMIFAIATPSAQAAFNSTKNIPILITAVTDPLKAGLVKDLSKTETNIAGTSDAAPIEKQLNLLKTLVPNAKNVGVLYNTSEANSEIQVAQVKEIGKKLGLEIVIAGVTNVNEIPQAFSSISGKIDAMYTITDNTIVSGMPILATKAIEKKIPIIGAEEGQINGGGLATEGIDYYKLGFQTGLMAVDVLNGKNIKDMPIETLKETQLVINEDTAKKLNIAIPDELKSKAKIVKGGN